jgi:hypothetical protein
MSTRPLSLREHAALLWVLSALDDPVQSEVLYRQSDEVLVGSGTPTMVELTLDKASARADLPDGPLPIRAVAYDDAGTPIGEVLVWIEDGLLSALEHAWYTDSRPDEFPPASQLRLAMGLNTRPGS